MNDTEGMSLGTQAAFATSMAIFFLVDILGNFLVIVAILTNSKLQITSNFYLFALAVTDITIGLNTMLPATIAVSANSSVLPHWMCTLTSFIDTTTLPLSLWILSASSLDRCVMIYKPLKYQNWITPQKTFIFIGLLIAGCGLLCSPILSPFIESGWSPLSYTCAPNFFSSLNYFGAYCFFTFPIPIIIVIVSYIVIFTVVTSLRCKVSRQKIRATMTVLAVIICLLVCILPVWCRALYILFYFKTKGMLPHIYPILEISLHWLLFSHSSFNPCIYGLINPQFQDSFKRIIFFFRHDAVQTRRCTYGDSATAMEVQNRLSQKRASSLYSVDNSVKEKKASTVQPENILHEISCSILRNNTTFLGLKFSKVDVKAVNRASHPGNTNLSDNLDSEQNFESTVATTTQV